MRKIIALLFLLPLAASSQSTGEKADSLMSAYVRMDQFNGTVLVAKDGKVVFMKGYGYKDAERKEPNTENTIFQIGSVTKQFTSTVVMKLQESGKLSVNDKLTKYFPGYPKGDSITVKNLLTHTSGIFNYTNDNEFMATKAVISSNMNSMVALFRDKPLNFSPGSAYNYSNSGYSLLGYIVEKASGKPWETMVRQTIFEPLKMKHSGFDFTHLANKDKATGYLTYTADNQAKATIVDSSVAYSAGSIYSTVGDLFLWCQAANAGKILKAASWKEALTPVKNKYAYGMVIDTTFGHTSVSHSGGIFGFSSYVVRYPEDGVSIILLNNSNNGKLSDIATSLSAILYNQPYKIPEKPKEIAVSEEVLQRYVGEYQLSPTFSLKFFVEKGKLISQATGQSPFEMFAVREYVFSPRSFPAEVEFKPDASGKITECVLIQNGSRTIAKKIK